MHRVQLISFVLSWIGLAFNIQSHPITVLTEHLPPFQIVDEQSIKGLATEMVDEVFSAAQIDYQIQANPWTDSYRLALKDPNMCLYSTARIPERENAFQWIGEIASVSSSFYSLANRDIQLTSLEDAKKYLVAVIKDDVTHHFLRAKGFEENKHLYIHSHYETLLALLEIPSRKLDLVVLSNELFPYRLNPYQNTKNYRELMKIEELTLNFYLACNKMGLPDILNKLTNAMSLLEQQGKLQAIREKWSPAFTQAN